MAPTLRKKKLSLTPIIGLGCASELLELLERKNIIVRAHMNKTVMRIYLPSFDQLRNGNNND